MNARTVKVLGGEGVEIGEVWISKQGRIYLKDDVDLRTLLTTGCGEAGLVCSLVGVGIVT
jgi:hypothetical protein